MSNLAVRPENYVTCVCGKVERGIRCTCPGWPVHHPSCPARGGA